MNTISKNIQSLLTAIKSSEEYLDYKKHEAILEKNPELWGRVDAFRSDNFRLQNDPSHEDLFEQAERLAQEFAELRKIPEVNAYLAAELEMCRVLQKVCTTLLDGVDIRLPNF